MMSPYWSPRLGVPVDDEDAAATQLLLLKNTFEVYHRMMTLVLKEELNKTLEPKETLEWCDGLDGLADSLRLRIMTIGEYLGIKG